MHLRLGAALVMLACGSELASPEPLVMDWLIDSLLFMTVLGVCLYAYRRIHGVFSQAFAARRRRVADLVQFAREHDFYGIQIGEPSDSRPFMAEKSDALRLEYVNRRGATSVTGFSQPTASIDLVFFSRHSSLDSGQIDALVAALEKVARDHQRPARGEVPAIEFSVTRDPGRPETGPTSSFSHPPNGPCDDDYRSVLRSALTAAFNLIAPNLPADNASARAYYEENEPASFGVEA